MSTYLLEIGTEELPANFAESVVNQFKSLIKYEFEKNLIEYKEIFCSSTPRRIVLLIKGLIDNGNDNLELRKGPKAEVAFVNGKPTKAAEGFARSLNVNVNELKIRKTERGDFVFGEKIEKGKLTKDLLRSLMPKVIKGLQGQRFMKWNYSNFKFSRPIRWIISLYNEQILDFTLAELDPCLEIGKISRGHRLYDENIKINHAENYLELLEKSGVIADREHRKNKIQTLIESFSKKQKLLPDFPDNLLNELTDLVETPDLIIGSFDNKFLSLPSEVLCTVMKNHQRYVPLLKQNKNNNILEISCEEILSTNFLCISNGLNKANSIIRKGNENVLKARFSDAKFFVDSDLKITCSERNQKIKNISYLDGLGNVFDRVDRIKYISSQIYSKINNKNINFEEIVISAELSKHDLCSEIVNEFPELQGVMGGKYLKREGYSDNVSLAVSEHYLPRFSKDRLPSSEYGAITALSDKLETIISMFFIGKRPSGSSDPFALRRNLNGVIQIIWQFEFTIKIDEFMSELLSYWFEKFHNIKCDYKKINRELHEFIKHRILSYLEESNYDRNLINGVSSSILKEKKLFDIFDLKNRIRSLERMKYHKNSEAIINLISRYSKLANTSSVNTYNLLNEIDINVELFEKDIEIKVFEVIEKAEKLISSSSWTYDMLISLFNDNLQLLNELFDNKKGVLIMAEDIKIRNNRLNLVALVRNYSLLLADFTLLSL